MTAAALVRMPLWCRTWRRRRMKDRCLMLLERWLGPEGLPGRSHAAAETTLGRIEAAFLMEAGLPIEWDRSLLRHLTCLLEAAEASGRHGLAGCTGTDMQARRWLAGAGSIIVDI